MAIISSPASFASRIIRSIQRRCSSQEPETRLNESAVGGRAVLADELGQSAVRAVGRVELAKLRGSQRFDPVELHIAVVGRGVAVAAPVVRGVDDVDGDALRELSELELELGMRRLLAVVRQVADHEHGVAAAFRDDIKGGVADAARLGEAFHIRAGARLVSGARVAERTGIVVHIGNNG